MVMFAVFVDASEPDKRLLNASPDEDVDAEAGFVGRGGCLGFELDVDGVIGLELGAELPAEESMENTSCWGFRGCKLLLLLLVVAVIDPSF
jgi:hypothetical protein